MDDTVRNYSKVILELGITRNSWLNLESGERSVSEFHRMVRSTEEVLWAQNAEYIRSMQEALASVDDEDDLVMETVRASQKADAAFKARMRASLLEQTADTIDAAFDSASDTFDEAVGSIAEFASEEVREEMQGLRDALSHVMQSAVHNMDQIAAHVREEFAGEDFSERTTVDKVTAQLKQFPPQGDGIG
jgi:ABC-type transporter Mla subunit MlaD